MSHESVTNEHDVVLPPSNCGQKIGEIAIAGDEDDGGWRRIVFDERHDIHWIRYEITDRFPMRWEQRQLKYSPIIIKSTVFFPLCGQSRVRGEHGSWMDGIGWTDQLETSHKTEVQIGGMIAWQRICPGAGGTP